MKKLFLIITFLVLLAGCKNSASNAVEKYFEGYHNLNEEVLEKIDVVVNSEELSNDNKIIYKSILKKQYETIDYEIMNEKYDGDEAKIDVKVTVFDLYKSQKQSSNYLVNHSSEFQDENGNYSEEKYISYKLENMLNFSDKVTYTITLNLSKNKDGWFVSSVTDEDIEKIHGIYNYEKD